ncbi:small CPxCG-related zinc finger protein [Halalkaliarchaeum desulfuricum]|uniref:Small CPxCG-related zinc finger protein n=1 Tax=Halalkaliarchaeum desulfuricum TaxID=2055893 RepID=A0A343TMA9_9EURY|nr:rubrerythrin-like domain-containing protein [Halalkaliarchaeum desulfuricum]AUX10231.1 small CPxCG-related zinc finger protein [Halalkaliarchaeum desulfuricum]
MTVYNSRIDPYEASYDYYECVTCGYREVPSDGPSECPDCGGWMRDIAVSRE